MNRAFRIHASSARSRIVGVACLVTAGLLLSGCSAPGATDGAAAKQTTIEGAGTLASEVPKDVRARGTVIVGTDASYPPMEYMDTDGKTIIGMEVDLGKAIASVLGLKFTVVNGTFDTLIPGLSSGKYNIAMSSMNDTKEREEKLDFVTLWQAGSSFVTLKAKSSKVKTLADLCGLKVAVLSGSVQQGDVSKQADTCASSGEKKPATLVFADQSDVFLALSSGRADVVVAGGVANTYAVKQSSGKLRLSGAGYDQVETGIAIPKSDGMAEPIRDAVNVLIENGEYAKILKRWGGDDLGIDKSAINVATNPSK